MLRSDIVLRTVLFGCTEFLANKIKLKTEFSIKLLSGNNTHSEAMNKTLYTSSLFTLHSSLKSRKRHDIFSFRKIRYKCCRIFDMLLRNTICLPCGKRENYKFSQSVSPTSRQASDNFPVGKNIEFRLRNISNLKMRYIAFAKQIYRFIICLQIMSCCITFPVLCIIYLWVIL